MMMSRLHSLHFSTRQSDWRKAHHFPHRHRVLFSPGGMSALGADESAALGLEGAILPVLGAVFWPAEALDKLSVGETPDSLLALSLSVERALGLHGSDTLSFLPVVWAGLMGRSQALMQRHLA